MMSIMKTTYGCGGQKVSINGLRKSAPYDPEELPECEGDLCETCKYYEDNCCCGNGYEEKEEEE